MFNCHCSKVAPYTVVSAVFEGIVFINLVKTTLNLPILFSLGRCQDGKDTNVTSLVCALLLMVMMMWFDDR